MPDPKQLASLCEGVLAVAGEPVAMEALLGAAGEGVTPADIEQAMELVSRRHAEVGSGFTLEKVAGGWRFATRPELEDALRSFLGMRSRARLSQAALETLAIVAYRQPITTPEINFLRGVNSLSAVRTLLDRSLIKVSGRKEVVGQPLLYRTTREFLVHFGLDELSALPTPEETAALAGDVTSAT